MKRAAQKSAPVPASTPGKLPLQCALFLLGALIGLSYVFVLPPLQAPDEFAHLYRAYGVSTGSCVAAPVLDVPKNLRDLVDAFPAHLEQARRIKARDLAGLSRTPLDESVRVPVRNEAINLYNCLPYLPSALSSVSAGSSRLLRWCSCI